MTLVATSEDSPCEPPPRLRRRWRDVLAHAVSRHHALQHGARHAGPGRRARCSRWPSWSSRTPAAPRSAHYHQQDQFQLVVGGHGTLGLHDIKPVTVHFAGAHTAYGPIRASQDEGVYYFTLRNGFDPGARFMAMPENRAALRTVPGRRHREVGGRPAAGADRAVRDAARSRSRRHGRLALRPAAGERVTGPDPAWARSVLGGDRGQPRACRRQADMPRCPASSSIPTTRRSTPLRAPRAST